MPRPPATAPDENYPFVLNTDRVRDHWHTLSRTGMSPRPSTHTFEPYAEIHPEDADRHQLAHNILARVTSPDGEIYVRVRISDAQQHGSLFVPIHWNDTFSSMGRVGTLVSAITDPLSGQPEFKHGLARIEACDSQRQGFILTRRNRQSLQYPTTGRAHAAGYCGAMKSPARKVRRTGRNGHTSC